MNEELLQKFLDGDVIIENDLNNPSLLVDVFIMLRDRGLLYGYVPEGSAKYYRWRSDKNDWLADDNLKAISIVREGLSCAVSIHDFYKNATSFNNYSIF